MSSEFTIKDSGERRSFGSGMVRDTDEGKTNFLNVRFGPMLRRWADHLTRGRIKYPDVEPGVPNWTLAEGVEEFLRAKESAARHFEQWLLGDRDEDHAAAVFFNLNLAEYALEKASANGAEINPALGAGIELTKPEPAPLQEGDRVRLIARARGDARAGDEGVIEGPSPAGSIYDFTVRFDGMPSNRHYINAVDLERVGD